MRTKIIKCRDKRESACFWVAKELADELLLNVEDIYTLRAGLRTAKAKVRLLPNRSGGFVLSKDVFNQLLLPGESELNIALNEKGELMLGPVIGVFVNPRYIKALQQNNQPTSARELDRANSEASTLFYFFTIEKINWLDKAIKGWTKSAEREVWECSWLPMPDVVYDRAVRFTPEEKPLAAHIREQFKLSDSVKRINSKEYLDKWWTYEALSKYEGIQQYLPETIRYRTIEDLAAFLLKYPVAYLKSFYGSGGREVFVVTAIENKGYHYSYYQGGRFIESEAPGLQKLEQAVTGFFAGKRCVIQQGLNLLTYQGKNLDMRILLEKDGAGHWTAIYNQVRVGEKSHLITNYSLGGKVYNFSDLLPKILGLSPEEIAQLDVKARQISIEIARSIEKEYGPFGEIGMDLGIDRDLKFWFIEANSKPDKDPEPGLEDLEGLSPQSLAILEYGKHLAGFNR